MGLPACIKYDKGSFCGGGLKGATPKGFYSEYNVEKYEQGKTSSKRMRDIFWKAPQKTITGREIETTLPYSEIGVSSGQTIRILIEEQDSTYDEKRYFPELMFTLK